MGKVKISKSSGQVVRVPKKEVIDGITYTQDPKTGYWIYYKNNRGHDQKYTISLEEFNKIKKGPEGRMRSLVEQSEQAYWAARSAAINAEMDYDRRNPSEERKLRRRKIAEKIDKELDNFPKPKQSSPSSTAVIVTTTDPSKYYSTGYLEQANVLGLTNKELVISMLNELRGAGYDIEADGYWGPKSLAAYNEYQRKLAEAVPLANIPDDTTGEYKSTFDYTGSNKELRDLGFNNYEGLKSFVKANPDHPFSRDMIFRFGDVDKWTQNEIESTLGVKNRYRRGKGGDYSDIMRSMAEWAGKINGEYDRKYNIAYNQDNTGFLIFNPVQLQVVAQTFRSGGLISKSLIERFKKGRSVRKPKINPILLKAQELGWSELLVNRILLEAQRRGLYKPGDENKPNFWNNVVTFLEQMGYKQNALSLRNNILSKLLDKLELINDVSRTLLEELWNSGAFNGVTKNGKLVTYKQAVDGKMGPMTQQAMKNKGKEKSTIGKFLSALKFEVPEMPSLMQVVMNHKVRNGVTEPFWYVNPNAGMLYRISGDNILDSTMVATGADPTNDGMTYIPMVNGHALYDRSIASSSTPAGVFTLGIKLENGYNNEPAYALIPSQRDNKWLPTNEGKWPTLPYFHGPATEDREKLLRAGNRKLTFGCIQLPGGKMRCYDKKGYFNMDDTVYVEPTVNGNYLYSNGANIRTHFGSTPEHVSGSVWGKNFDLDNWNYNTGY